MRILGGIAQVGKLISGRLFDDLLQQVLHVGAGIRFFLQYCQRTALIGRLCCESVRFEGRGAVMQFIGFESTVRRRRFNMLDGKCAKHMERIRSIVQTLMVR